MTKGYEQLDISTLDLTYSIQALYLMLTFHDLGLKKGYNL